jgi:hypothetical protein
VNSSRCISFQEQSEACARAGLSPPSEPPPTQTRLRGFFQALQFGDVLPFSSRILRAYRRGAASTTPAGDFSRAVVFSPSRRRRTIDVLLACGLRGHACIYRLIKCHFITCGANRTPPAPPPVTNRCSTGAAHRRLSCSARLRRRATLRAIWSCRLYSGYYTAFIRELRAPSSRRPRIPMLRQCFRRLLVRRNENKRPLCAHSCVGGMAGACGFTRAAVLSAGEGRFFYNAGLRSRRYCARTGEPPRSCCALAPTRDDHHKVDTFLYRRWPNAI